ncbi:hypothetical protein E3T54_12080 [Cryobacterium sp. Sr8]|uniref:HEPN domain-containing protein n=1 Tax=Cryobacterium sp. Sr8 TaxID=1259203 RepID=UPI0010699F82|nr:HEPN domain-containing protein [Cryobacterium sp. Sr8]TFD75458.1 hypothetical protein E3T54_12080 [Cryobacterium sp. Sr8]
MAFDDSMLAQFHLDIDRAGHLLRLIKEFRSFAGRAVPAEVQDGSVDWKESTDLITTANHVRTDLPILAGSILLYVCGRFEYFVRELLTAMADDLAANATVYSDLPESVRSELMAGTLEIAKNPHRFGYTPSAVEQMLISLARSLDVPVIGAPVSISSRVLSLTDANMNSRTLGEVFKRVNVSGVWSDIGKQAPLKTYLVKVTDGDCTADAMNRLDKMMKIRNGIAHPTGTTSFPDPDQVIDFSDFLRVLSSTLVDVSRVPRSP